MKPNECEFVHLIGNCRMNRKHEFLPDAHRNMWFFVVDPVTGREILIPNPNEDITVRGMTFTKNMTLEQAVEIATDAISRKWPSITTITITTMRKGSYLADEQRKKIVGTLVKYDASTNHPVWVDMSFTFGKGLIE